MMMVYSPYTGYTYFYFEESFDKKIHYFSDVENYPASCGYMIINSLTSPNCLLIRPRLSQNNKVKDELWFGLPTAKI
jgi:hypothetical protein